MQPISEHHPLRRHFAAAIEHVFCTEVGLCDPLLTDYLAELLVSFTHIDRLTNFPDLGGRRLEQVAAKLGVLFDDPPTDASKREQTAYRHIGDFTLFWAGMYPEHLRRSVRMASDVLVDYVTQGKKSYAIVADLAQADDVPPARLFRHLSDDFEYCLHGLGIVRREWERPELHSSGDSDLIV